MPLGPPSPYGAHERGVLDSVQTSGVVLGLLRGMEDVVDGEVQGSCAARGRALHSGGGGDGDGLCLHRTLDQHRPDGRKGGDDGRRGLQQVAPRMRHRGNHPLPQQPVVQDLQSHTE